MRVFVRSVAAVCLAVLSTVVLVVAWTAATAVQLAATALIMGGTQHPLSTPPDDPVGYINPYMANAVNGFINPAAAAPTGTGNPAIASVGPDDSWYAVITPEQFFPLFGSMTFDDSVDAGLANVSSCVRGTGCDYNDDAQIDPEAPAGPPLAGDEFDIFGYSQSAVIASLLKRDLIENPGETPPVASFFLLANPMRPNGGILARGFRGLTIPLMGITFYGATPTNSCDVGDCMPTVDAVVQYDLLGGDAPASLTNLLAFANAALGYIYLHGEVQNAKFDDALYQGSHGDTDYYLYPTARLPLLRPLEGFVPSPILTALNAPLQAAIEGAYRRDVNPGIVTGMGLLPFHNPVQTILNIIAAIPVGIDDALAEATGDPTFRPLGTSPTTSPFGVGGPDLPAAPEEPLESTDTQSARTQAVGRSESVDQDGDEDGTEVEDNAEEETVTEEEDGADEETVDEEEATEEDTPEPTTPADEPDTAEATTGEPGPGDDGADGSADGADAGNAGDAGDAGQAAA